MTRYDPVDNGARMTDALGNAMQYSYGPYRQTKATDALGKETATAYDAEDNLLSLLCSNF